jgi:hypothetical protein
MVYEISSNYKLKHKEGTKYLIGKWKNIGLQGKTTYFKRLDSNRLTKFSDCQRDMKVEVDHSGNGCEFRIGLNLSRGCQNENDEVMQWK